MPNGKDHDSPGEIAVISEPEGKPGERKLASPWEAPQPDPEQGAVEPPRENVVRPAFLLSSPWRLHV